MPSAKGHDIFLTHERQLHIHLGKLRLAVGAQILIAETFDDLIVTVKTRHHQQLFEQLRRLGQGIELTMD